MRSTILLITALVGTGLAAGCTVADGVSGIELSPSASAAAQLKRANAEVKDAVDAIQAYAFGQKADFVDRMKKEIAKLQQTVDELGAKVERSSAAATKADAQAKVAELREEVAEARKQLDLAEKADEASWERAKTAFRTSYAQLGEAVSKTRQWMTDKIEA
jgi:gamma-glutamyl:cysteine ligase YbdK (ATP-grasp superfamily)